MRYIAVVCTRLQKLLSNCSLEEINRQLNSKSSESVDSETKKELRARKRKIEETMEGEIRAGIREKFDYDIPIATVAKAGITSTGGVTDNELKDILTQYTPYRQKSQLWTETKPTFEYKWSSKTGKVERIKNKTEISTIEW